MTTIYYHANCTDGWTAAWVADKHYKGTAQLIPVDYGKSIPETKSVNVYFLDFFPGVPKLNELAEKGHVITVLDHHETAKRELDKTADKLNTQTEILLDQSKSGALLAWEHFFHGYTPPPLVQYVSDHDTWKHDLPNSLQVSALIQSYEHTLDNWDSLAQQDAQRLQERSAEVWRVKQLNAKLAAKNHYFKEIRCDGRSIMAAIINISFPLTQDALTELKSISDLAIGYVRMSDGKWKISARSCERARITARQFCEQLGGGGHEHAAGAVVDAAPLNLL